MPKMSDADLRALLAAEYQDANAAASAAKLSADRSDAMAYYLGDMTKDMPTLDGRSKAVSMDTADTIEGMMPPLIEIFAGGDEVVKFNPVGPEDEPAAQQETDFVNHVFLNKNPGFIVLYSFIKDALLSKVGVVKAWWEEREEEERETYYDLSDDAFALLAQSEDVEIIEHSEHPVEQGAQPSAINDALRATMAGMSAPNLHDVTVLKSKTYAQARVMGVPPEEFGIERNARSLRDCNYCFHKVIRTENELREQGYDAKQIKTLPSHTQTDTETTNRDSVNEGSHGGDTINDAARKIQIVEHYVRLDYEKTGKACLYRVVTGGEAGNAVILKRDGKPDIEPFDYMPFAAMTPVILTHRFWGRSVADLVRDIQQIKTAVLRGLLDNVYLINNTRTEVSESHASESTLDDLLSPRPGGVVRTKTPGGLQPLVVQAIGNHVYPLLEYQDATREWRTGVTRAGMGLDANALQNQTATAANQLFTAAQARIKLIARIFAETGIKDLFWLLHATIRKHGQQAETVRLRNQWVPVDPRTWKSRNDLTVSVGLGNGSKGEQLQQTMMLIGLQKEALAAGKTNLVKDVHLYNSAKVATTLMGHKDVNQFFADPSDPKNPAPPLKQDPKVLEAQGKLQLEGQKAQATLQLDQAKHMAGLQADQQKAQADAAIEIEKMNREFALKREQMVAEITLKQEQMVAEFQLRREQMAAEIALDRERMEHEMTIKRETAKADGVTNTQMGGAVG